MMAASRMDHSSDALIGRMPDVRGRLTAGAPLGPVTWFRVGGPAEIMFRPADMDDLVHFMTNRPSDVAIAALGVGSNTLVRDGGVAGVIVRLGAPFARAKVAGDVVEAGAGALDLNVALTALDAGLTGLEFLRGIPGTIGGALRMNAGAYGREIADVLIEAEAVDAKGKVHRLKCAELGLTYRHSSVPEDWIFTRAWLQAAPGDKSQIKARMDEIQAARELSQPIRTRTGGSTFANPPGAKAWELIDRAGCRGLRIGGAMVSEQHCNFLINTGDASAADIEELGETVRRRVRETSGVDLRWEIRRIGVPAEGNRS